MKIIFKIARAELRNLFYSPIAWFVVIIFYVTFALTYSGALSGFSTYQEVMLDFDENWAGFDTGIGTLLSGVMNGVMMGYLYLFIPLLTMGIINREISNGTIKLLYSSPVTTSEIVLGKYLGLMLFNLLLLTIFSFFLWSIQINTQNAEYLRCLSMILGVFLLINTYAAIGLFISCITGYQIVAAVITFAVFFALSQVQALWQQYDLIRDITYYLTISGKAENMMRGLITSRDVIYFLLVIPLFIGFAIIKLNSTQKSGKRATNVMQYALLVMIVVVIGYFSSRPGSIAYADVTKNKVNTLHPAVQEVLTKLDGSPLTVTLFTNLLDRNASYGLPQTRNNYIWGVWEPLIRFYPNIDFKYEYYYDVIDGDSSFYRKYPGKSLKEIMAIEAEMLGIRQSIFRKPEEMRKMIDLRSENMQLVMLLRYKGKEEFLRTYHDPTVWPDQNHFGAVFKRLVRDTGVHIHFLSGHYERNPFSYAPREFGGHTIGKGVRRSLINDGVDTDSVAAGGEALPDSSRLLVIADPKSAYSEEEKNSVIKYLEKGGNALFYLEPGKQFILAPILKTIGVYPDNGTVVRPDEHEMPHIFHSPLTKTGNFLAKEPRMEHFQRYGAGGGMVVNEGMLNLSYESIGGFSVEPVISTPGDEKTWIENGILVVDSAAPVFNAAEGDQRKTAYTIALKLSRKIGNKEQRIIVTGDTDFMVYNRLNRSSLQTGFYSWLLYNQYPVYTNYPIAPDNFLKTTAAKSKITAALYLYLGSGILLLSAIMLLVRRKRK